MRLLFEIGMEENPARFLEAALADLKRILFRNVRRKEFLMEK